MKAEGGARLYSPHQPLPTQQPAGAAAVPSRRDGRAVSGSEERLRENKRRAAGDTERPGGTRSLKSSSSNRSAGDGCSGPGQPAVRCLHRNPSRDGGAQLRSGRNRTPCGPFQPSMHPSRIRQHSPRSRSAPIPSTDPLLAAKAVPAHTWLQLLRPRGCHALQRAFSSRTD